MSTDVPPHDHPKAPMIPHLSIDPIKMSPRSTGIHDVLCHVRYPGERHGYFPSSLLVL